jgi:hypothetical protein
MQSRMLLRPGGTTASSPGFQPGDAPGEKNNRELANTLGWVTAIMQQIQPGYKSD